MQEITSGNTAVVTVNVIVDGDHTAATIDTSTTRLSTHPSAVPTVTSPATGVYKIKFSGLSPSLEESDNDDGVSCAVNGTIGGVAWTEYHIPLKVALDKGDIGVAVWQQDISLYEFLSSSFAGHVLKDIETAVNSGGSAPTAAEIYNHFTSGSNEDAFKADVSGLSTFDHTSDQVVASNMRGTDGANTVAPDNASISSILADTNELQQNQGDWATATGFSTHDPAAVVTALQAVADSFKANVSGLSTHDAAAVVSALQAVANDFKADVSGVATQASVDSIDSDVQNIGSDVSTILTDTNELQQNQGDWATATGFSTHSASDVVSGLQAVSGDFKADVSSLLTTAAHSASLPANFSTLLIGTGADAGKVTTSNPAAGAGSAHTAQDVANLILATPANKLVTNATGQVETSNASGGGGATAAEVYAEFTSGSNADAFKATGFSTHSASDVVTAMQVVADDFKADVSNLSTDAPSAAEIYSYFTDGTRENVFKADVSGLNDITAAEVYSYFVDGSREEAFKANTSGLSTISAADVYNYFTAGSREDLFKADVSNLSTDAPTAQEIYNLFTSGSNEDAFKADVSNITTDAPTAQEIYDLFTSGNNEDAFKADVSGIGGGGSSAADIYDYFVDGTREDAFKADVSDLATSAELAQLSSGGTGLNQITVRVQDSNGDALQGAVVNIDNTVLSLVTTPTGEVVFNLDNSTYDFDVSPPAGYDTPASQQLVVSGDSTIIFTLTGSSSGGGGDVAWVG